MFSVFKAFVYFYYISGVSISPVFMTQWLNKGFRFTFRFRFIVLTKHKNKHFVCLWEWPHLELQVLPPDFVLLKLATFHLVVWRGLCEVGQLRGNRPEPVLVRFDLLLLSGQMLHFSLDLILL